MGKKDTEERLRAIPLFRDLTKQEIRHICTLMTPVQIQSGRTLIKAGDVGREFMIILDGTAAVRRNGRKVAELGPGDYFGELSVLSGARRNADVVATSDMTVEVLSQSEFHTLLDENAKITRKILTAAVSRLSELEKSPHA
jgi:CRP/FNR family transcriptional regulator, cyclic AMP receptor protein